MIFKLLPDSLLDFVLQTPTWLAIITAAATAYICYTSTRTRPIFSIVNTFPNNFTQRKAHAAYLQDARGLIATGLRNQAGGPITLDTPCGARIVLPPSLTDWVKNNKDLITKNSSTMTSLAIRSKRHDPQSRQCSHRHDSEEIIAEWAFGADC
ncbi:hypothetical protein Slin14017_G080980 [Septoria linicola]|nr:hypothetical protein Slin14017_G080980 [Septoria linicola]